MEFKPYTYHICWTKYNLHYYGVRLARKAQNDLWVIYFTSSKYVKQTRLEYGEPDIIEIRKEFNDIESAKFWETKVLTRLKVKERYDWLNRYTTNYNGNVKPKSEETRENMSKAMTGKSKTESHKLALSKANIGKFCWVTDGTANKQMKLVLIEAFLNENLNWKLGKFVSEKSRKLLSETRKQLIADKKITIPSRKGSIPWNKGLTKNTDERIMLSGLSASSTKKGKPVPNLRGNKNGMFGKTHSEENKKAASERVSNLRWYTDGLQEIYIHKDEIPPKNFFPGRKKRKRRTNAEIAEDKLRDDKTVANTLEDIK